MKIYCCECQIDVEAKLVTGKEVYSHRADLYDLPFWKCDACKNSVGCHHKTTNRTKPLGNIPNKELKNARKHIHKILDPLWKKCKKARRRIYKKISDHIGYEYHTGEIKTLEEARKIYKFILRLEAEHNYNERTNKCL